MILAEYNNYDCGQIRRDIYNDCGCGFKMLDYPYCNYFISKSGRLYKIQWRRLYRIESKPRKDGYHSVILNCNGKQKNKYLHRIVLEAFIGKDNRQCNHIDGNKSNNDLSNLEYCTRSENQRHRFDVLKTGTGTEKPVIRSDGKKYPSIASVEKDGFIATGVYKVCAGQMKTHKGYGWNYAKSIGG